MKNTRKRKLDILLSKDALEIDEGKVKNLKPNVPEPMSIEETQSESESEDEVEDEEDDQAEEVDEEPEEIEEPEDKPDSEPEVIEFVDPIQLIKKKRAEQLAKRAKMT